MKFIRENQPIEYNMESRAFLPTRRSETRFAEPRRPNYATFNEGGACRYLSVSFHSLRDVGKRHTANLNNTKYDASN